MQCSTRITQRLDFGFELDQIEYCEEINKIDLDKDRSKQKGSKTTDQEKTELRGCLGAISYKAQQTGPHESAETNLLLSNVNSSTVSDIASVNKLLDRVRAESAQKIIIHPFSAATQLIPVTWTDASHANRADLSSTEGLISGMTTKEILDGVETPVSLVQWASHKIDGKCKSPGDAERCALVNGQDENFAIRFQWTEMMGHHIDFDDIPSSIKQATPGVLVTDSTNAYDKLSQPIFTIKGKEKSSNIGMLKLVEARERNGVHMRWVHGDAQLANSLTKIGELHQIRLFFKLGCRWRVVYDPKYMSARRRKAAGIDPMANAPKEKDED